MKNNMSFNNDHDLYDNSVSKPTHVIDHISAGTWEFDTNTNEVKWSDGFYTVLGYEPGEIECSYDYFFEHLLYHEDRKVFAKAISELGVNKTSTSHIRLLTKRSGYQWFENTSSKFDPTSYKLQGSVININQYKLIELHSAHKDFLLKETGRIAKVAVWELEVNSMKLTLSKEGYDIFELNHPIKLSMDEAISFFEPEHRELATKAIDDIIKFSKSFDLELSFRTAKNRVLWLRFKAIPIIDSYGKCTSLRGIFQDIDHLKKKEMILQSSLTLSSDQNKRLQNFAYIVSHNLRSHTGNLKFMVDLFNQTPLQSERDEIFEHIKSISKSLNTTVEHLEEVVKIQAEITKERKLIEFKPVFKDIVSALANNINESDADIEYDFSKCPAINYIPAYLESILQNMLTNAIKYRSPARKPRIKCYTFRKNKSTYLVFEDNGLGIDLARHGDAVFGMYKTFHKNSDSKGIGLFITRNQVESLGGTIKVESAVDVGTKFTIKFN
jgi:signal transduction histidine kinase